jgi:uncharacterized membrane protein
VTQPPFWTHFAQRVRGTWEAKLFVAGLVLTLALAVELATLVVLVPDWGLPLLQAVPADALSGKEGALLFSISGGAPWWLAAQVSALQHLALGTLVFPLFLFLLHRYHGRDSLVMRRIRRIEAAAERRRAFVTKWGPVGLFLFMMVPFLVNGPLVGAILGRLAGIPTPYLILPVVGATLVSSYLWAASYAGLVHVFETIDPVLPKIMSGAVIGLLVAWALVDEWRDRRRERKEREARAASEKGTKGS